jgi:hypothetical protein
MQEKLVKIEVNYAQYYPLVNPLLLEIFSITHKKMYSVRIENGNRR